MRMDPFSPPQAIFARQALDQRDRIGTEPMRLFLTARHLPRAAGAGFEPPKQAEAFATLAQHAHLPRTQVPGSAGASARWYLAGCSAGLTANSQPNAPRSPSSQTLPCPASTSKASCSCAWRCRGSTCPGSRPSRQSEKPSSANSGTFVNGSAPQRAAAAPWNTCQRWVMCSNPAWSERPEWRRAGWPTWCCPGRAGWRNRSTSRPIGAGHIGRPGRQ